MREIIRILKNIKENIIDILFPKTCVACGKEGEYVCENCSLFLSEAPNIIKTSGLEELVSIWEYEGLIRNIIFKIKYEGMFDAVNELVEKAFERREPYVPEDVKITFVPMFKKKEKRRGFNQAELIAKKVGKITGKEVVPLLEKIKDTASQTKLDKEGRMINVKDSFSLLKSIYKPLAENILLIDDIWTSGATMRECCKILKEAGAKRVWGFTLARTV